MKAKKLYVQELITSSDGDNRKFWDSVKNEFYHSTPRQIDCVFENESCNTILTGMNAVNCINSYFCNVSTSMSEKFIGTEPYRVHSDPVHKVCNLKPIGVRSVIDRIKEIDIYKSSGLENLSSGF